MASFWGARCCCGKCPEPDVCGLTECDYSETEWNLEDESVETHQTERWSATVAALYDLESVWSQDVARGAEAPSIKLETSLGITTSGVDGSVTVIDYLLFPDAEYTPELASRFTGRIDWCANIYGKQRFTSEAGNESTYPLAPCAVLVQDGEVYVSYGGDPDAMPYNCFGQWTRTVISGSWQKVVTGESGTNFTSDQPDFNWPAPSFRLGIGFVHQVSISEAENSNFKSLESTAHVDNLCMSVTRMDWPCYPRCPDSSEMLLTISGSSASIGGTCSIDHADTDGSFVLVNDEESIICQNTYPETVPIFDNYGEIWWNCNSGSGDNPVVRFFQSRGNFTDETTNQIDVLLIFRSRKSGPGVQAVTFLYRTTDLFDCLGPITLDLQGKYLGWGTTGTYFAGSDTHSITDYSPVFTITVPATVTLESP